MNPLVNALNGGGAPAPDDTNGLGQGNLDLLRTGLGHGEALARLASGTLAQPAGGLAGLISLGLGDTAQGAGQVAGETTGGLTYEPRTAEGQRISGQYDDVFGKIRDLLHKAPEKLQDLGLPAGVAATLATGLELAPNLVTEGRGLAKIPWDRMSLTEARAAARAGAHLERGSSGRYTGAPAKVTSPQALTAMRGGIDKAVEGGAFGADWYERARKAISESSSSPEQADKLSKMLALYSPQATPDINMGHAVKQINDIALHGEQSKAKPFYGRQAEKGRAIMAGESPELGPKVGVYEEHINPLKADESKVRGVNDIWMGRAYGYGGNEFKTGFGDAQHSFMTGENLLAAERAKTKGLLPEGTDPNVGNVQAAAWVGKRYNELKGQKGNANLIKALQKSGDTEGLSTLDKKLRTNAAQSYDTVLPKYTAAETYEEVPGRNTGHLSRAADLPFESKQALHDKLAWAGEGEHDPLYQALGMYDRPTTKGVGEFTETVKKPMLEPAVRDPTTGEIYTGPSHAGALNNMPEAARRRFETDVGDWESGFKHNPKGDWLTREQAGDAFRGTGGETNYFKEGFNAEEHHGKLASEDLWEHNPKVDVQVTDKNPNATAHPLVSYAKGGLTKLDPASESLMNQTNAFRSTMDAQAAGAWHALPTEAARAGSGAPWERPGAVGNYQELPWGKEKSGQVTDWLLGKVEPKVGEKLTSSQRVREALLRKNVEESKFKQENPFSVGAPREDLQRLRGMISEHGLEGVRALVRKAGGGIKGAAKLGLPAVTLAYLEGQGDETQAR